MWVRLSIFSQLSITQCAAVCFQFTHTPCDDWENIYALSYYHHHIGSMNYYPLFRVRSWNNCMHCMSLYILVGSNGAMRTNYHVGKTCFTSRTCFLMVRINIDWDCLAPHCIMDSRDQWEFPPFFRPQWQFLCTNLTGGKCLPLGLYKGTVKET